MSNFKSPNPNIAPLNEKEAAMIDQMSDAISTMPREHMSELQKWFLRLTEHTYRLQIKFQNLAIHASNQERKADLLEKLVNEIDECTESRRIDALIQAYREKEKK